MTKEETIQDALDKKYPNCFKVKHIISYNDDEEPIREQVWIKQESKADWDFAKTNSSFISKDNLQDFNEIMKSFGFEFSSISLDASDKGQILVSNICYGIEYPEFQKEIEN